MGNTIEVTQYLEQLLDMVRDGKTPSPAELAKAEALGIDTTQVLALLDHGLDLELDLEELEDEDSNLY